MRKLKFPLLILILALTACPHKPAGMTDPNLQRMINLREEFRLAEVAAQSLLTIGAITPHQYNTLAVPASRMIHNAIDDGFIALETYNQYQTGDKLAAFNSAADLVRKLLDEYKTGHYDVVIQEALQ